MEGLNVLQKLAEGSAVEAFLVRDGVFERNAILELVRPEVARDVALSDTVLKLTQEHHAVEHPHLISREHAQTNAAGRLYILSAPVAGQSLSSLLKTRGSFSPREIIDMLLPLTEAIACLHMHGHKHGNLSPDHVFVEPNRLTEPRLFDTLLTLTRSVPSSIEGWCLVKSEYLSPERIRGRRATIASDVYGLGVLMYELLTGKPPFRGPTVLETRIQQLGSKPPPLPNDELGLSRIIMRCLLKDETARYPDMHSLGQALRMASTGTPPPSSDPFTIDISTLGQLKAQPPFAIGPQLALHERLGDYELTELLGQGGMGRVFLGRDTRNDREVALKVLRSEVARDQLTLNRFIDEATMVSRIHHPHIVKVYDLVIEADRVYSVMEPLRGNTLGELLQATPLTLIRTLRIMRQVCEALDAAHAIGVIHRDVKPDNIFLCDTPDGDDFIKLLDFGVAKQHSTEDMLSKRLSETQGGMMVGTPLYMAPEQVLGEPVDERTDVYIVAMVLYRILKGSSPFHAPQMHLLVSQVLTKEPESLPAFNESGETIPHELAQLVMQCLSKASDERVQSMRALSDALANIEDSLAEERLMVSG